MYGSSNKSQRSLDSKRPGGGSSGKVIQRTKSVSAPKPPAVASMKNGGNKLRKGDC